MYALLIASRKTEKRLKDYISQRQDVKEKLDKLKIEPRRANGAHPLHGELKGKWACWLGSNIRLIYEINDNTKQITIISVGTHKIY